MKVPIKWLENYIKLEHPLNEFGAIMTDLEFMQDGPVKYVNSNPVIDLEVRQNRPDILSIIGVAREYSAFINKPVNYPPLTTNISVNWDPPKINLETKLTGQIKRFCTVEITDIKIKKSPDYIKNALHEYGIPSINNIVDITNFVMLEYGMPLHAFDFDKIEKTSNKPLITLRMAKDGEIFTTWQDTKLMLTEQDIVVADYKKPIAIAGIIGGANSDIDKNTKHIILESAVYDQAYIRRSSLRHSLRTDASTRHEKFLNPELVETAIRRAIFLIAELSGGKIIRIEDYYPIPVKNEIIQLNLFEVDRISGLQIPKEVNIDLLQRLGFEILEQKEAIGIDKNIMDVKVPNWRTDVHLEADLIEEITRLYGYDKIDLQPIKRPPFDNSTPHELILEDKIRDILVSLGLDEQVISPLVQITPGLKNQVLIQNPMNKDAGALRISLKDTLKISYITNVKAGKKDISIFEIGKVYFKKKDGDYVEERHIESLYGTDMYVTKVKPDFLAILKKLGIRNSNLSFREHQTVLEYYCDGVHIANLYVDGYVFYTEKLLTCVNVDKIPSITINTALSQKIYENLSFIIDKKVKLGEVSDYIALQSNYIKSVILEDQFTNDLIGIDKVSVTFKFLFEDENLQLTRVMINEIREKIIQSVENKFNATLRR